MMSTDTDVCNPGSQPLLNATPSSSSSSPLSAPQFGTHLQPDAVLRTCSVRGCNQALSQDSANKMCEGCRGRHRIYASTKRARRKLEKAAVVGLRRVGERLASPTTTPQTLTTTAQQTVVPNNVVNVNAAGASVTQCSVQPQTGWMQPTLVGLAPVTGAVITQPATPPPTWDNTAIDPQLFAEPSTSASTVSLHHSMVPTFTRPPYPSSSSSELAGALTLPTSNNNSTNALTNNYYRTHVHEQKDDTQCHEAEENEVAQALQAPEAEAEAGDANPADTNANTTPGPTDAAPEETGPPRPCSVKGCKAMIPSSYTFKMCPPCRTRYRTYGNTKRAKWKAEREAFDRELAGLRTKEDQRRKIAGERPLSESPDDLRAWELSIIDEEVPLPPHMTGSGSSTNGNSEGMMQAGVYLPGTTTTTTTTAPSEIDTLAARMCTVSHCHKLLPGFYRYKRCEQHRLQNRHHSKLKRVRERSEKAAMVQEGGAGVGGSGGGNEEENGEESGDVEEGEETKELGEGDVPNGASGGGEEGDGDGDREDEGEDEGEDHGDAENKDKGKKRRTRRRTTCEMKACQNMLAPGVRWRRCEVCRARERVFRREKKEIEEGQAKDVERFREVVRLMEEGVIPLGTGTGLVDVQAQAQLARSVSGSGKGMQEDQKEMENVEGESVHEGGGGGDTGRHRLSTTSTPASASATINQDSNVGMNTNNSNEALEPAKSYSLASYPHTFQSVFRANFDSTPAPTATANANANTTQNTHTAATTATSTAAEPPPQEGSGTLMTANTNPNANATTAEGQLTFHEYKPKPAASSMGKGRGLEMGKQAQVFRDMVQRDQQTSSGMVGPSSYHVYKSTPPPPAAQSSTSTHMTAPALPPGAPTPAPAATTTAHQHPAYTTYDSGTGSSVLQAYEPPAKRQKVQVTTNNIEAGGAENSTQNGQASAGPSKAPLINTATSSSGTVATTQPPTPSQVPSSPPSNVIPRQRKARAPRPKQPPPPTPAPVSHSVPSYPYMSPSQYPYSYYMPPPYAYSVQTSPPRASSSSASAAPTSSTPYPSYVYPYAYSYPPPGSYPPGTPSPGYSYLQASQYHPGVYALSPPPPHHQGSYTAPYGYSAAPPVKDPAFSYYQPPPYKNVWEADKKKRKSEETETSASSVSVPAPAPAPTSAHAHAPPQHSKPVVAQEYVLRPANVTLQPPTTTAPVPPPVPVQPAPVPTDKTVASNAPMGDRSPEALSTAPPSPRACVNKTCHRTIPTDVVGTLCEKCRMRIKRHQAKARQRFKLEPRKSVLMGRRDLVPTARVAVAGETAASNEVVAAA